MLNIFKKLKVWINSGLDRLIDQCDLVLMDVVQVSYGQSIAKRLARISGDLCILIQTFPRLSAYNLQGKYWKIIYIGETHFIKEILALYFPGENIQPKLLERVPIWQIGKFANKFLEESADLVIFEESRINPFKVYTPIRFTFPEWINQCLPLPESFEGFLVGKKMKNKREQITRAEKFNVDWYYSKSDEDFKFFHYDLYQPYISFTA